MITGVDVNMPAIRNPDQHMYIREWSGGILAGCFELDGRPCFQDGVPQSFEFQLLPEDWDHIRKIDNNTFSYILMLRSNARNDVPYVRMLKCVCNQIFFHI